MTATSTKKPTIPGPLERTQTKPGFTENQSSPQFPAKSSQKTNRPEIPPEIIEAQKRLEEKRAARVPATSAPAGSGYLQEVLDRVKARAIERGVWNQGPEIEAAPEAAPRKKPTRSRKGKKHSDFVKSFPKIFRAQSTWLVFDYVWRFAKKTKTNKLRWEGYMGTVAKDVGIHFSTVQRSFKRLEAAGIFIRWNTGKKFPANIASGSGPAYHHTVVTVAWSPAWLAWQKREARKKGRVKK
jgi:hypothetical protein